MVLLRDGMALVPAEAYERKHHENSGEKFEHTATSQCQHLRNALGATHAAEIWMPTVDALILESYSSPGLGGCMCPWWRKGDVLNDRRRGAPTRGRHSDGEFDVILLQDERTGRLSCDID